MDIAKQPVGMVLNHQTNSSFLLGHSHPESKKKLAHLITKTALAAQQMEVPKQKKDGEWVGERFV